MTSRRPSASTRNCSASRWSNWSRTATIRAPRTSSSTSETATCSASSTSPDTTIPSRPRLGGVQHIAISVGDEEFKAARARLDEAGIEYVGPDRGVEDSVYFRDPNGAPIELYREELGVFEDTRILPR
ncbi:MAG: VOC family protein [Nocardioidaceae bacterium]